VAVSKSLALFEPKVQLLANYLLSTAGAELTPTADSENGVRYLEAERITGDEPRAVTKWLEDLAVKGVLDRRFVSKLILCPKCGSMDVPVNYCCPHCRSVEIDKKALFEHLACGIIDKEDNFKKNGQLACPRCGRSLGQLGITHKAVGTWFLCRTCLKPFDRPLSFHVCGKCKQFFVIEDAVLIDAFAYKLSKEAESQLKSGGIFLKPIKEVLEHMGYDVAIGGRLHGASGADHRFDLIGIRSDGSRKETVAVDVVSSDGLVGDSAVTTMFAKRYDANPDKSVLVAIPGINESGKKLAAMYRISIVEATSGLEAVEKLKQSVGN